VSCVREGRSSDKGLRMNSKAQKVVLAVVILAVAAFLTIRATRGGKDDVLLTKSGFVCVATGEIFELKVANVGIIPAKNPKTGQMTLVPCARGEDGKMRVSAHYRLLLRDDLKDLNKFVDAASLEVTAPNAKK
jgi:hypothetical protein